MRNKLTDLNNHLFAQLERLNDTDLTGDDLKTEIDRAKAVSSVATQIVQTAKITVDAMKLVGSGRIEKSEIQSLLLEGGTKQGK